MTGAFYFSTDAAGKVAVDTSSAIIHGSVGYTVHGDMHTDGVERQLTIKADRPEVKEEASLILAEEVLMLPVKTSRVKA